jgi:anti-sigma regulatory factor (Ser/Thr protein kinase)
MNIKHLIIQMIRERGAVKSADISEKAACSRACVNRHLQELRESGKIVLVGRANRARYVLASEGAVAGAKSKIVDVHRVLTNKSLSEDDVLAGIKKSTGIFDGLSRNVDGIVSYAFLEMLNNAIDHSGSLQINVSMRRDEDTVSFEVIDEGVGIFNNIVRKKGLAGVMQAIQDLLKGKLTTMPDRHSGEGIFFTSKVADVMTIQSSNKKMIFNNLLDDLFVRDIRERSGTKVSFSVGVGSRRLLDDVFRKYTDAGFEFSATRVIVHLYQMGTDYISRSQARRVVSGLEQFKSVTLDFKGVETVGQGFADEIFRVWRSGHPGCAVETVNMNENVEFMVRRAQSAEVK